MLPRILLLLAASGLLPLSVSAQTIQEVAPGVTRIDGTGTAGYSTVALHGSLLAAGADRETVGGVYQAGAVDLFRFDGTTWLFEARLLAWDDTTAHAFFGYSVALSSIGNEEYVAIGAPAPSARSLLPGRVYLFRHDADGWKPDTVLTGYGPGDRLGASISLDSTRLAAGQWRYTGDAGGSVYTWERADGAWHLMERLKGPHPWFRYDAVSISGDLLLVRPRSEEFEVGNTLLFRWNGQSWQAEADLTAEIAAPLGLEIFSGTLSGERIFLLSQSHEYDSAQSIWHRRTHPLMLVKDESGWQVEADLYDSTAHYGLPISASPAFAGDYAALPATMQEYLNSPYHMHPATLYHRVGSSWAKRVYLTAPDVPEGQASLDPVAMSADGRFFAAQSNRGYPEPAPVYIFDLSRISSETTPDELHEPEVAVRVYPVPAQSRLTVQFLAPPSAHVQLCLHDLVGRQVMCNSEHSAAGSEQVVLDVSRLPSGVYLLRLSSEGYIRTTKVLVAQ